jgi:hypothetical protein
MMLDKLRVFAKKAWKQGKSHPYRWSWLILSILGSTYFAFWQWPLIYATNANLVVNVHFKVSPGSDSPVSGKPFWVLNTSDQRKLYLNRIEDKEYLYYTPCAVLDCDPNNTDWVPISPRILDNCSDAVGCTVKSLVLSEQDRNELRLLLRTRGKRVDSPTPSKMSVADPGGWGDNGRIPVWLFCVFLATKFGKAWNEFLFQPNTEEHERRTPSV